MVFRTYPPTSNVLMRTRMIYTPGGGGIGSGILIDVNDQQFFVTAKHVFGPTGPTGRLSIPSQLSMHVKGKWVDYQICRLGVSDADLAVVQFDWEVEMPPIQLGDEGTFLGQDLVILGFPTGLHINGPDDTIPIAGRGTLSKIGENGHILVQCNAFHGFSGGPVVSMTDPKLPLVIGIISRYHEGRTPMDYAAGHPVPTGFVVCVQMTEALDVIKNRMRDVS